jgi:hypothetical protein
LWLKRISEPAAASLQEGLEETLMVEKRLRKVKARLPSTASSRLLKRWT